MTYNPATITPAQLARAMSVAERWSVHDPDPQTKAEAAALINLVTMGEDSGVTGIVAQFGSRLSFGTAGLRGELGAGPARMNRMVVMQTSAAFATWLLNRAEAAGQSETPSIVVGFDARTKSDVFARAAAEVFAGYGLRTILMHEHLPTPLTAFAVRQLGVSAGVMITASHNPPKDNGYKVFLGDADGGSQITSPTDSEIAELIEEIDAKPFSEIKTDITFEFAGADLVDAYIEAIATDWSHSPAPKDFKVVYTAMHGVGSATTRRLFEKLGLPALHVVEKQDNPDGSFPTVAFPNPEEPGALDLAYEEARSITADLIIAHDPDADRLAVALPDSSDPAGYRPLTGNQLGLLLGWQAAERHKNSGGTTGALACTIVSSPVLREVAKAYDLQYEETLSGFKWVSRVPGLVYGFEEALGYLTRPNLVRDKDGISAAADLLQLALALSANGKTLWDKLDEAAERFGSFASSQITIRLDSMQQVAELAARVRQDPPTKFGDTSVTKLTDLLEPGNSAVPANVLKFDLADGSRIMVRPSGTEPKLKIYIDATSFNGDAQNRHKEAKATIAALEKASYSALNLPQ